MHHTAVLHSFQGCSKRYCIGYQPPWHCSRGDIGQKQTRSIDSRRGVGLLKESRVCCRLEHSASAQWLGYPHRTLVNLNGFARTISNGEVRFEASTYISSSWDEMTGIE